MRTAITNCVIPVSIGGLIYILGRHETLKMFHWFQLLHLDTYIYHLRLVYQASITSSLPSWVLYSLPDALWMYSFTSAVLLSWKRKLSFYLLIPFTLGAGSELGQYAHLVRGTYDSNDLICYCTGFLLSIIIITKPQINVQESPVYTHHL
jgi:hypothetical protein